MSERSYKDSAEHLAFCLKLERQSAWFFGSLLFAYVVALVLTVWFAHDARGLLVVVLDLAMTGVMANTLGQTLREIHRITIQLVIAKLEQ